MNGKPFVMMVHSNAHFYLMTNHASAQAIGVDTSSLKKAAAFGITSEGHVSDLGRAETTLSVLQVGKVTAENVPMSIFEIPSQQFTREMDGMLGINWLHDKGVIVDYDQSRLGLPSKPADAMAEDARILARGYVAHRMIWDPQTKDYYIQATINGIPARMGVSTVAENVVDSLFAKTAGITLGPVVDQNGGPRGAIVPVNVVKRQISIVIDGQTTTPQQPWSWDIYAYSSLPRPTGPHDDGYLGADFMLANQAIIDFGTATLFVAKR